LELGDSHVTKCENFKIQDDARPQFKKKILFGHKSATDFSEILHWEAEQHGDSGHVREFKMADGRHIANRKIAISTKNHQILMKFGTQTDLELDDSYVTK